MKNTNQSYNLTLTLVAACLMASSPAVEAEDLGSDLASMAGDATRSAAAAALIYTTGQGPGNNVLIDVRQTQVAEVSELKNRQGIQNINSVYIADSRVENLTTIQYLKADRVVNDQGIQRLNNINVNDSRLNNVSITQTWEGQEIKNRQGIQNLNLVTFNHDRTVQDVNIIQVGKGRRWENEQGVQSVNTIIQ